MTDSYRTGAEPTASTAIRLGSLRVVVGEPSTCVRLAIGERGISIDHGACVRSARRPALACRGSIAFARASRARSTIAISTHHARREEAAIVDARVACP
jgi:hypothetical protein